jgi:hypothetical protein
MHGDKIGLILGLVRSKEQSFRLEKNHGVSIIRRCRSFVPALNIAKPMDCAPAKTTTEGKQTACR